MSVILPEYDRRRDAGLIKPDAARVTATNE